MPSTPREWLACSTIPAAARLSSATSKSSRSRTDSGTQGVARLPGSAACRQAARPQLQVDGHYFVQRYGRRGGLDPCPVLPPLSLGLADEKPYAARLGPAGELYADLLRTHRQDLAERPLHHHRVREIDEVRRNRRLLLP